MKIRFRYFLLTYVLFVVIFVFEKPLFMLRHLSQFKASSFSEWMSVIWNGLSLDLTAAAWLTVIPGLLLTCTIWSRKKLWRRLAKIYFLLASLLMAGVFVADMAVYPNTGSKLTANSLGALLTQPSAVFGNSVWSVLGGFLAVLIFAMLFFVVFYLCLLGSEKLERKLLPLNPLLFTLLFLLLEVVLLVPVFKGMGANGMDVSKAYFSANKRLNLAAVNPLYSSMATWQGKGIALPEIKFPIARKSGEKKEESGEKREGADALFDPAVNGEQAKPSRAILNTPKPNVLVVVLKNMPASLVGAMGGDKNVTVCLNELVPQGLLFNHIYATSTNAADGLRALLNGEVSASQQPSPSLVNTLRNEGYLAAYYSGLDIDGTNLRSQLKTAGFQGFVSQTDFSVADRQNSWGVHDFPVFNALLAELRNEKTQKPWIRMVQTASAQPPYTVPYHRVKDQLENNAFAYSDACLGHFISELKKLPQWEKTLVVVTSDCVGSYPQQNELSTGRFHIPMLLLGGALKETGVVDTYGSQADLAATLLAQLGLSHKAFTYSKDLLSNAAPHFAYFSTPNGYGMLSADNQLVIDQKADKTVVDEGKEKGQNEDLLKAFREYLENGASLNDK
ncbi:MAG: sulfatase-like hydrolase/transferase [Prevotella sp.]|nr:sulfatase-like hydrolase/transferase [Prevotella sp.]